MSRTNACTRFAVVPENSSGWISGLKLSLNLPSPLFCDFPRASFSRLTLLFSVVRIAEVLGAIAFLVLGIIALETGCGVTDEYVD
jgi:hypothetical protein